ncbi:ABC transporter permease [Ketogulonicigenium vulgare]|uniref:Oligopeptide ABC transporter (Permease) n=1 Tax=Ketogulonicigenium vulgare (strain WSH-001) TaxID=759362 RepID=F9Y5T9_KETVW|nr:ABC transporter permease [Ketogulonicigenium vulgare]ADO43749.1 oligopeptide ABC transporter (permease) [Ketogulonicigenium vulgare Y25]AEM42014.1 Oligopeptide ABC transporter (Permease) [Ketogulonicigenium vulgare WSH-001]ALJ82110.1 ABC transporter permease [Ketogulonicigenium vulgare]ANW34735.1 ABC transporter permease [Ketogulonicigenium vulgare]AOZ55782.1 peptide ABC transporter permease [Ketogulonicigenium vulgare]
MIIRALGRFVLQAIPVLYIVSLIVFVLVFLTGDPTAMMIPDDATEADRAALIAAWGLDQPAHIQYVRYMANILQGDFGTSYRYGTSALPIVLDRLPATLLLTFGALVVALIIAIPAGIIAALRHNSAVDYTVSGTAVLFKAMPNFWVGIMLILIFGVWLRWLPVSGSGSFAHLILPAITLGTGFAADLAKLVRASMLEVLGQDYIRTAMSKGIPDRVVIFKHALKNAAIPTVTMTSLHIIALLGGALVTETVFSWPGLGQLIVQAIYTKDMAVIQIAVFVITIMTLVLNFLTDLAYRLLDPRIRL